MKRRILTSLMIIVLVVMTSFLTYKIAPRPYQVHHHANMVVYIDGKKWDFSGNQYMEEVSRCDVQEGVRPTDRVHLHENKGELVHVHMAAATWGDLFSNLYWNFGRGYLIDDFGKMYTTGNGKNLYYFINGELEPNPHNKAIESEDKLLIWYGTGSEKEIKTLYLPFVPNTAKEYNNKADPASCSTNESIGFIEAIKELWPHGHE